ncbi:hypothetical protein JCM21531_2640 [Acetivibrio straminisolvens JCM 21531]|uniref:Uncharacterized protein n=1 Tax=Acetivibrio straminisolvens JCM 21531 TaxID=1294263 RepID=W4V7H9_9FIRM|nr:hypothetical protein JCM21531_2640 [Acetivibrio straminisolvens JCM 21531]
MIYYYIFVKDVKKFFAFCVTGKNFFFVEYTIYKTKFYHVNSLHIRMQFYEKYL